MSPPGIENSPVQTQMAVAVLNSSFSGEYHGNSRLEGKAPGRRRLFVQTETGCVLGMELDRSDDVHTVKRKLQIAFNVSTDETLLTFGDMVLKGDLTDIRNDSPLLLTRNSIQRSSSTPCLSPCGRDLQQKDRGGPIEILGKPNQISLIKPLVHEMVKAMKMGVDPLPVHSGLGGAYYFRNAIGECVAIVKPADEEPFAPNNPKGFVGKSMGSPGLKPSVRVGETGYREVAAYLLDHDHFSNVPATALVKITHWVFNVNGDKNKPAPPEKKLVSKIASFKKFVPHNSDDKKLVSKIASLQQFVSHDFDASDYGSSSFPVSAVHRIGILDIRILNTDRHAGNLLVRKPDGADRFVGEVELIPIDHGLCLPECLEDPYFEWIHWPQSSIPFSEDELNYIEALDPIKDSAMLRKEIPMIREACLKVLILCTVFLKEAAASGLCLAEIGEMMSREFRSGEEEPSELELVCLEARKKMMEERELTAMLLSNGSEEAEEFLFDMDYEDADESEDFTHKMPCLVERAPFQILSKLKEEDEGHEKGFPNISNLSISLKSEMGPNMRKCLKKQAGGKIHAPASSTGQMQMPASATFVKVADMKEDEWSVFLDKFQELLGPAFVKRKWATLTQKQKQRQRLGTSCQF